MELKFKNQIVLLAALVLLYFTFALPLGWNPQEWTTAGKGWFIALSVIDIAALIIISILENLEEI